MLAWVHIERGVEECKEVWAGGKVGRVVAGC